ncbi:MAG TPA: response regulator [Opitutaceae bacterium]|nr:response regulator [Opitutaceae bacterium]
MDETLPADANLPDNAPLVLMVEDDADAAFLLRRLLRKTELPIRILHLNDGAKALNYFEELDHPAPDSDLVQPVLVLLDIKMPKVNGFEVLQRIRERSRPRRPVVIVTTSDDPKDKQRAADLGADAFLAKFPTMEELRQLLQQLMTERSAR